LLLERPSYCALCFGKRQKENGRLMPEDKEKKQIKYKGKKRKNKKTKRNQRERKEDKNKKEEEEIKTGNYSKRNKAGKKIQNKGAMENSKI
jgi:hypothetical protein